MFTAWPASLCCLVHCLASKFILPTIMAGWQLGHMLRGVFMRLICEGKDLGTDGGPSKVRETLIRLKYERSWPWAVGDHGYG